MVVVHAVHTKAGQKLMSLHYLPLDLQSSLQGHPKVRALATGPTIQSALACPVCEPSLLDLQSSLHWHVQDGSPDHGTYNPVCTGRVWALATGLTIQSAWACPGCEPWPLNLHSSLHGHVQGGTCPWPLDLHSSMSAIQQHTCDFVITVTFDLLNLIFKKYFFYL